MDVAELRTLLDPVAEGLLEEHGVPGTGVGIRIDGENHALGYGVTNSEFGLPVDGDTLFQIGSTSKTFTATAVMRLVEEGKLSLDDRVIDHLPKFRVTDPEATEQVTVRHLVTHTAGWMGDYGGGKPTGRGDDALRRRIGQLSKVPQLSPIGTVWSYNNAAFGVAGRIVEVLTKKPFEQVVKEWILDPLGMERSFYFPEQIMTYKFALGHVKDPEGGMKVVRPWWSGRAGAPAGGITSSPADQLRYAEFHLGAHPEGKQVLSADTVSSMQQPLAKAATMASEVGISWLLDDINGVRTVSHGGTMIGQTSAFMMVPERDFAVTVLTNAGDEGKKVHRALTKWALKELLGLEKPVPQTKPMPDAVVAELIGTYAYYSYGSITVDRHGDGLSLHWTADPKVLKKNPAVADNLPEPVFLRPIGDLLFIADEGQLAGLTFDFVRRADGSVGWLRLGGRVQPRLSD